MPLFKRKPYVLRKPPKDLLPDEDVFQVRFTKEVFREYAEYLSCMKFYRRRVWTCKVSGKMNLTYEEALVSERKATEKVQSFPKEFMGPVLHMVQLSPLRIDELVDRIYKVFKERYVPGEEVTGVRDEMLGTCRIVKAFEQEEEESPLYEVAWLDEEGKKIGASETVLAENLRRKKLPFSRALLKAFIRDTASSGPSRNSAWIVHDKLSRKYKIPIQAPERPKSTGTGERESKRLSSGKKLVEVRVEAAEEANGVQGVRKRKRSEAGGARKKGDGKRRHVERVIPPPPIRYPIEDSLVQPSASDPPLSDRPVAATDFVVPVECTGDVLMVWDFCSLFCKALLLSPFSLEDLEKSLDYKEGEAPLVAEMTHALLRAALTDPVLKEEFQHKRKKRFELTVSNWKDDLCDFLELPSQTEVTSNVISMIRQGYYKQVKILDKVNILRTLVTNCLNSGTIRNQIDDNIEEMQQLVTLKRELEAEEVRRRREERELLRQQRSGQANGREDGDDEDAEDQPSMTEDTHPTGWTVKGKRNSFGSHSPVSNGVSGKQEEVSEPVSVSRSRKDLLKKKVEKKLAEEAERERQRIEEQRKLQEKRKEQAEALAERRMQEQKVYERQRKHEQLERDQEKLVVLTTPLGKDRFHNRYWFFGREGRLFVESDDSSRWGYYAAKEELDALIGSLNVKGIRERALHKQLEQYQIKISNALAKRSKELAQRYAVEEASVRRSERVRTGPRLTGFMAYVNKLRPS